MWIVRLALARPYTIIVMTLLMLIGGGASLRLMSTDIFPTINIPVVSVIWTYNGLAADEFEKRITIYSEYALSSNVNDVKSMESQTIDGVGVIRLYFHPGVKSETAIAQATAVSQAILRRMPSGVQPPILLRYMADSVPLIQLSLSSDSLSETQLYDYGIFRIRQALAAVPGSTLPAPYGGKIRQLRVELDNHKLQSLSLSPRDVNAAINAQNLMLPSGTARIGSTEYRVALNNSPLVGEDIGNIPIRDINGKLIYIRDVASVHDGAAVQNNVVNSDGARSVLLTVLKNGSASTLDVVNQVKNLLPTLRASAPKGMNIQPLFDQSFFVQAAVDNVIHEGLIAAFLTGSLILLFLGSWRSTLIVLISIPISILVSLTMLYALGHTLNIMTLGGLSLAIGILVDDATVEIENVHRNLGQGKNLLQAILDGAEQIATPALVATACICIVFLPVALLEGPARYLFIPFAQAVVFAVATSYWLSRTLVPLLVKTLEKPHQEHHWNRGFLSAFEKFRSRYSSLLLWGLQHPSRILVPAGLVLASAALLAPMVGRDFFPSVDAGQIRMHVKDRPGQRIEDTERSFARVEDEIRRIIPKQEIELITDNIGVPAEAYNLAFGDSATLGPSDGEILISLNSRKTDLHILDLRARLQKKFPDLTFYFQPADIVSQILSFGLPAPINVRVAGYNRKENLEIARGLLEELKTIPGAVDVHMHQDTDAPQLKVEVDRTLLARQNLTQSNLADDLLVSLSSNTQVTPNYWVDPLSGIPYFVAVQTPTQQLNSFEDLLNLPVSGRQLLRNVATLGRGQANTVVNHYNIQPVYDLFVNVQSRDLGGVSGQVKAVIARWQKKMAPGNRIMLRGLVDSMDSSFYRLAWGFAAALMLVFLLLVVNFQSFSDAAIIIAALPGAIAGIVWGLFLSHTTFNVPSLMGAIMTLGVATANSVLIVSFAKERMAEGDDSVTAAFQAGRTRLRPVMMTALAMIIGMIPMSLALGQGAEQNAPLGRAVIGGLSMATLFTLFFVPAVFALVRRRKS